MTDQLVMFPSSVPDPWVCYSIQLEKKKKKSDPVPQALEIHKAMLWFLVSALVAVVTHLAHDEQSHNSQDVCHGQQQQQQRLTWL